LDFIDEKDENNEEIRVLLVFKSRLLGMETKWNESNKARCHKGGARELQTLFRTDIRRTGKIIININIEVFL
jgi:hypothetical protein